MTSHAVAATAVVPSVTQAHTVRSGITSATERPQDIVVVQSYTLSLGVRTQ